MLTAFIVFTLILTTIFYFIFFATLVAFKEDTMNKIKNQHEEINKKYKLNQLASIQKEKKELMKDWYLSGNF